MTIDELIYWLDTMDKQMQKGFGTQEQEIQGKLRLCCIMCGNCPSALADQLRNIKENK